VKISKQNLRKIIREEYSIVEAEMLYENKVKDAYGKIKSLHAWLLKPENAWIRKMAIKMLGEKDPPEKEEVKDAKVQAEAHQPLMEEKEKKMGFMDAYKKLKGMYNWVMSDENRWARDIVIDMLKSGDEPAKEDVAGELDDSGGPDPGLEGMKKVNGNYITAEAEWLKNKKEGDKTPTKRVIKDVEDNGDSIVFLLADKEIETYKPDPNKKTKSWYLVKEQKALRYSVIRKAKSNLLTRQILRERVMHAIIKESPKLILESEQYIYRTRNGELRISDDNGNDEPYPQGEREYSYLKPGEGETITGGGRGYSRGGYGRRRRW
jgi:hypothetical protein